MIHAVVAPPLSSAAERTRPAGLSAIVVGSWMAIAWGVLAFGAVYPWAYWPLVAAAAGVGIAGLGACHTDVGAAHRRTLVALVAIGLPMLVQLVPVPREVLVAMTPRTDELLRQIDLMYAAAPGAHPISLDPAATLRALAFVVCLGLFALGLAGCLSRQGAARLVIGSIVLGAAVALVAIVQRSAADGLIYGFWKPQEIGRAHV